MLDEVWFFFESFWFFLITLFGCVPYMLLCVVALHVSAKCGEMMRCYVVVHFLDFLGALTMCIAVGLAMVCEARASDFVWAYPGTPWISLDFQWFSLLFSVWRISSYFLDWFWHVLACFSKIRPAFDLRRQRDQKWDRLSLWDIVEDWKEQPRKEPRVETCWDEDLTDTLGPWSYCISLWECLRISVEAPDIPHPGHMFLHFCTMAVSYCIIYYHIFSKKCKFLFWRYLCRWPLTFYHMLDGRIQYYAVFSRVPLRCSQM